MPDTVRMSGRDVRQIWQQRFDEKGAGHRYWLYTHIPFCPQICTFCQCSTSLKKSDDQIEAYLDWIAGEIDFLAPTTHQGVAAFQYVGGGTPNILSDAQLRRLLGMLNDRFVFAPDSRRTFEFLPSSLRPELLPLARSFGFNRLSCGVQSWSPAALKAVKRATDGLDRLGRTIREAFDLGYDEFNVDLIQGIASETPEQFLSGLLEVLALRPTTVTIHRLIPVPTNPVFTSVEDELAAYSAFKGLERTFGRAVSEQFPDVEWVSRPNSWFLVDRQFRRGPKFSLWYYSDNERIHIDQLGLGRFAQSDILGKLSYENLSQAERFDPDENSYRAFRKSPAVDAALDLVTDLVGDGRADLGQIASRYGAESLGPLRPVLEQLARDGRVSGADERWETSQHDGFFIDDFWPLLDAARPESAGSDPMPAGKEMDDAIRFVDAEGSLLVFVEPRDPARRYFAEVGRFGVYYRVPDRRAAPVGGWVDAAMQQIVGCVRDLVTTTPNVSAKQARARLKSLLETRADD